MPAVKLCVVVALMFISRVPSKPTPLINLTLSSAVAVSAFPLSAPFTKYEELSVIPVSTVVNPVTGLLSAIVNEFVDTIATTISDTVICNSCGEIEEFIYYVVIN